MSVQKYLIMLALIWSTSLLYTIDMNSSRKVEILSPSHVFVFDVKFLQFITIVLACRVMVTKPLHCRLIFRRGAAVQSSGVWCWLVVLTSVVGALWCSQDARWYLSNILSLSVIHCLAAYSICPCSPGHRSRQVSWSREHRCPRYHMGCPCRAPPGSPWSCESPEIFSEDWRLFRHWWSGAELLRPDLSRCQTPQRRCTSVCNVYKLEKGG